MLLKIQNQILKLLIPVILLVIFLKGSSSGNLYSFKTRYMKVPVDHFSSDSIKMFNLRYLVNANSHIKGGPIFVYTGGERDITITAQNTGFLFEIAPIFNAVLVFIEHRYYGNSLPFGNKSFSIGENLMYLSTSQALEDFVCVINKLKKKFLKNDVFYESEPIIAFGGYYAGMLSAWLRMKYPFLVRAALTSSAPILYIPKITTCEGYYQKVTFIFEKYGHKKCVRTIQIGWDIIINLTRTKKGMDLISSELKLCKNLSTLKDVDILLDWLASIYVKLSMVNYDYPSEYYEPVPAYPVKSFCDKLTSSSSNDKKKFIQLFATALETYTNYTGKTVCNNIYQKEEDFNEIAWQYQLCTELIMPKCSTDKDMFITKDWNYKQFARDCYTLFGVLPKMNWLLLTYGGKNLQDYSNILFSNSLLDPSSWGGVYLDNSYKSNKALVTYEILDSSHLAELRGSDASDNIYILKARQFYISTLKNWLN